MILSIRLLRGLAWAALISSVFPAFHVMGQSDTSNMVFQTDDVRNGGVSLGFAAGALLPFASGEFRTQCDCRYKALSGFGTTLELTAEYPESSALSLALRAGYQGLMPVYRKDLDKIRYAPSGEELKIAYSRKADISMHSVTGAFLARWKPGIGNMFAAAGPSFSYAFSASLNETEKVMTPGFIDYPSRTNMITLHDGPMDEAISFREFVIGLYIAAGWETRLGADYLLLPEVGFTLPLGGLSRDQQDWKIPALHARIQVLGVFYR